jgi:uncharacterized protein YdcH (DUF465 family)
MDEKELKELLIRENPEFRKLHKQHQLLEKKLVKYGKKSFLTDREKVEEKELKKQKLALKDKMYLMMEELRKSR